MQYADAGLVLQLDSNNARCILLMSLRFAHLDARFGTAQRPVPRQHLGERVAEKRRLALLRLERPPRRDNAGGEAHDACTSFAVRLWMRFENPWFHVFMDVSHQEAALLCCGAARFIQAHMSP